MLYQGQLALSKGSGRWPVCPLLSSSRLVAGCTTSAHAGLLKAVEAQGASCMYVYTHIYIHIYIYIYIYM